MNKQTENAAAQRCPECGAEATNELDCQSAFNECLAAEFTDSGFGSVHHLTVATYMLQHSSKLTGEGWLAMRQLLIEFLDQNRSPLEIRLQSKNLVDSGKRTWKLASKNNQAKISRTRWSRTILDAIPALRQDSSDQYCAKITAWAKSALEDVRSEAVIEPRIDTPGQEKDQEQR